jgi:hypothetical protein
MIIDRVRLAGDLAYLTDQGAIDLATSANGRGQSLPVGEGLGLELSGVHLLLRAKDMHKLYARTAGDGKPLLAFAVTKEMFPEFFADPYAHRVHSIAGFEDFQRGFLQNMRAMEVEGKATLVSLGWGGCAWLSPIYRLPMPVPVRSMVWELASARLAPDEGFGYLLRLQTWHAGQDPTTDTPTETQIAPATGSGVARPSELRHRTGLDLKDVIAYRVTFKADVQRDTDLLETQIGPDDGQPLGRPLLRAVHLLEPITSAFAFHSLHELEMRSSDFSFLEPVLPLQTLTAFVALPALLVHREALALEVRAGVWELAEARLDAEVRVRPPVISHLLGA